MSCCGSLFVNLGGGGGGTVNTGVLQIAGGVALDSTLRFVEDQNGTDSILQLSTGEVGINRTIALSAGATNVRLINETYTINNSGAQTGNTTGIFLNATETALNGMGHNLMDLQVGGVSRFRGTNAGALVLASGLTAVDNILTSNGDIQASGVSAEVKFGSRIRLSASADGVMLVRNNAGTDFNRLQFGGTTNAFPAIKRNSAAIDFRLADDTGFCNIRAGRLDLTGALLTGFINDSTNAVTAITIANTSGNLLFNTPSLFAASGTINASARVQIDSTTQGFLPPRMTTTDRGNISSPATGLKLYNTTTNNTDTFDGTNWQSFGKETKITGSLEVNIAGSKVINAIEVSSAMGLGFYNAAAIIQPVTGGATATYASVSGTEIKENDTFDGYTVGEVVKALRNLGLLA